MSPSELSQNIDLKPKFDEAESRILAEHRQKVGRMANEAAWRSLTNNQHDRDTSNEIESHEVEETPSTQVDHHETNKTAEVSETHQTDNISLADIWDGEKPSEDENGPEQETSRDIDKIEQSMRELIKKEYIDSATEYFRIQKGLVNDRLLLRIATDESRKARNGRLSTRSEITDTIRDKIDSKERQLAELPTKSPESHVVAYGYDFIEHIKQVQDGEVATTPYVAEHLAKLEKNMDKGRPTFVHGHLGSGKTELAIMAARHSAISRAAYEEARAEYGSFAKEHPEATKPDRLEALGRFYRKNVAQFERALHDGDHAASERFNPLIISGSKDLTAQDLYADKTLKLTKFNGKPLLEHKKDLDAEIEKWCNEHPDEAKDQEVKRAEADKIIELYKLKNQAFGTEVETIKQAVYRGVEEGRPVIIDEANAIPAAVLISMNDILQRRPGQSCYVPGMGRALIKEGFSITMTGNLSSGNIDYLGTEDLNPAALSRLSVIEHDYLPMSDTDPDYRHQTNPRSNELFHVMVASLAERSGDLRLPEMDKSMDKLFKLAQLAHATQLVFEGKWRESQMNLKSDSGDDMDPSLKKSVLSIRNILNVLEDWDKGSEKDLDKALWDSFVSNMINPDDQNFVLGLAKQYGFFSESDGWQIKIKERGAGFTSLAEAHPGEFQFNREPMETMDLRNVVDVLYGMRPERTVYPEIDLDELEDAVDDELQFEDLASAEALKDEIAKAIGALEKLGGQFGCDKASTDMEA